MAKFSFLIILSLFSVSSFGQAAYPCVNPKGNFDFACACAKKNKCYTSLSGKEQKNLKKLNRRVKGGLMMKITKENLLSYKLVKQAFYGKLDVNKVPYKKLNEADAKMAKYQKKMKPRVERNLKKRGVKDYKLAKRAKKFAAKTDKQITPHIRNKVSKFGFGFQIKKFLGDAFKGISSSLTMTTEKGQKSLMVKTRIAVDETKDEKNESKQSGIASTNTASVKKQVGKMMGKKFKVNDIHQNNRDIFKVISMRYMANRENLDANAKGSGLASGGRKSKISKRELASDISELIKKF
jgi:hypothetical protein